MATNAAFWEDLGLPNPSGPLSEPMRFRIETDLRKEVDRIEAYARGIGYRDISRSDIIRVAIASFVDGFRNAVPDISLITLPEERQRDDDKARV
jgi:hypothetical protein